MWAVPRYLLYGYRDSRDSREPFQLFKDEFFVCGDNSPNSLDSRLWMVEGRGNHGVRYRQGLCRVSI